MNTHTLQQLGVSENTLSEEEKYFLNENGYLSLGPLLTKDEVAAVNKKIKEILAKEGEDAGWELAESKNIRHPKEEGADRLADLVNKDPVFTQFFTHFRVLAAVAQVVGQSLKLSSLNFRAAKPGRGLQKLHADWHEAVEPNDFKVCNSIWLLDDFSKENGATRLVPKTHRLGKLPQEVMDDPWEKHPEEICIEAPAGTVVVVNSHTWHGGTTNLTNGSRRAIHAYYCRADQGQQIDQKKYITEQTRSRLSRAELALLDV